MANKHTYKITVEHVSDPKGVPGTEPPLVFTAENHDNILTLATMHGKRTDKDLAFLMGMKLFGECLLEGKDNPLFSEIRPQFGEFMKKFKASRKGGTNA